MFKYLIPPLTPPHTHHKPLVRLAEAMRRVSSFGSFASLIFLYSVHTWQHRASTAALAQESLQPHPTIHAGLHFRSYQTCISLPFLSSVYLLSFLSPLVVWSFHQHCYYHLRTSFPFLLYVYLTFFPIMRLSLPSSVLWLSAPSTITAITTIKHSSGILSLPTIRESPFLSHHTSISFPFPVLCLSGPFIVTSTTT